MAAIAGLNRITNIGRFDYEAVPNVQRNKDVTPKTWLDHDIEYNGKSHSIYRCAKLIEGVTKLAALHLKHVGNSYASFCNELAAKFTNTANSLAIFRLPEVTRNAYRAVRNWSDPSQGPLAHTDRDQYQKIHDVTEGFATYGFVASFISGKAFFANLASGPDTISNMAELIVSYKDWLFSGHALHYVNKHEPDNAPVQQMFQEKMRHTALLTLKAACSVFSGLLGIMALAFGGPLLPPLPLILLGLTGTITAIAAYFFKETAAYKLPEFPEIPHARVHAE